MPPAAAAWRPRLLTFPFVGSGARFYHPWRRQLAGVCDVLAAQLPGRERRIRESPQAQIEPLVRDLADALPALDRPYALFGHSLGGTLAFAFALELRRRRLPAPERVIISATPAPHLRDATQAHRLDDAGLLARLRTYDGTPEELFETPQLVELFLPVIRADFALFETWQPADEPPLEVPLTIIAGTADRTVTTAQLEGWRSWTAASLEMRRVAGDHFFVKSAERTVLEIVREALP